VTTVRAARVEDETAIDDVGRSLAELEERFGVGGG
jgi:hypothetical protein